MATNPKAGTTPKDNQIKPITQTKEPEHELTVDPLQISKLYPTETKALLDDNNVQAQISNGSSEVTKNNNDANQDPKETAIGVKKLKEKEKVKEKKPAKTKGE